MKCGECQHFDYDEFATEDDYCYVLTCYLGKHLDIDDFSEDTDACNDFKKES